jgi:hypothetical protein
MRDNLIKRLRNPAFFTETSERNLMNEAADALEEWEKETKKHLILALSVEAGVIRVMKERDEALAKLDKAVEALHFYADFHEVPNDGPWGADNLDFGRTARNTLLKLERSE